MAVVIDDVTSLDHHDLSELVGKELPTVKTTASPLFAAATGSSGDSVTSGEIYSSDSDLCDPPCIVGVG